MQQRLRARRAAPGGLLRRRNPKGARELAKMTADSYFEEQEGGRLRKLGGRGMAAREGSQGGLGAGIGLGAQAGGAHTEVCTDSGLPVRTLRGPFPGSD